MKNPLQQKWGLLVMLVTGGARSYVSNRKQIVVTPIHFIVNFLTLRYHIDNINL
jgi:hypothetical protein